MLWKCFGKFSIINNKNIDPLAEVRSADVKKRWLRCQLGFYGCLPFHYTLPPRFQTTKKKKKNLDALKIPLLETLQPTYQTSWRIWIFFGLLNLTPKRKRNVVKTRPCTTVRDSEDILERSPFQKYTTCWVFLALNFAFAHLTHGNIIFDTLEQSFF